MVQGEMQVWGHGTWRKRGESCVLTGQEDLNMCRWAEGYVSGLVGTTRDTEPCVC